MSRAIGLRSAFFRIGVGLLAGASWATAAIAEEPCGVCNEEIVVDEALANCFLEKYQQLADKNGAVVAVDLSDCPEGSRDVTGVIAPLAAPGGEVEEPDVRFMVTKGQLACIKNKLEEPGVVIDPMLKIDLANCA